MSNITITSIKPSYMNKNIPNIKNETILDKIKKQRQKHIEHLVKPSTIIYYKDIDVFFLLNVFYYYSDIDNICIVTNQYTDIIYNISKLFNIQLNNYSDMRDIVKSNKYNFIATFIDNVVISKDFFFKNQKKSIYTYNHKNNIKTLDKHYFNEHEIHQKYIEVYDYQNIFHKLNIHTKNIYNSSIIDIDIDNTNPIYTFFNHIYVLNLSKRPNRLYNTLNRLKLQNIYSIEHFIAVDGGLPEIELLHQYYLNQPIIKDRIKNNIGYIRSSGSFAILLSMKNMILDAIRHKYKNILVLQDDILFIKNFEKIINIDRYKKRIGTNWKLLYVGANDKNSTKNIKNVIDHLYYLADGKVDGAFAIGIDESIYQEIIDILDTFILPFDSGPLREIQLRYPKECYVLYPNLIIADVTSSDCRGYRNQHTLSTILNWNMSNYCLEYNKKGINKLTIIFYDKYNIFNEIENNHLLETYLKIPYDIIILTKKTKNSIYKWLRVYEIKKNNLIEDINMGVIYSYSKYISINILDKIDDATDIDKIKINKPILKSDYLLNSNHPIFIDDKEELLQIKYKICPNSLYYINILNIENNTELIVEI